MEGVQNQQRKINTLFLNIIMDRSRLKSIVLHQRKEGGTTPSLNRYTREMEARKKLIGSLVEKKMVVSEHKGEEKVLRSNSINKNTGYFKGLTPLERWGNNSWAKAKIAQKTEKTEQVSFLRLSQVPWRALTSNLGLVVVLRKPS